MMPPAIKFTGNPPLKAEGQKGPLREAGGAAFATFMLSPSDGGAISPEQIVITAPLIADEMPEGGQVDELVPEDDEDPSPLALIAAPDQLLISVPEQVLIAPPHDPALSAEHGLIVPDAGSDGAAEGSRLAPSDARPAEIVLPNKQVPDNALLSAPVNDGRPAMAPDREIPTAGVAFNPAGRLRAEAITITAPRPIETPDYEQAAEPSEMVAEIRIQAGVEAKGDIASVPAPLAKGAPQVAHLVVRQIASHVADQQGGQIEITLTPEELGTVRLVISAGDRPAVAVYAENPATLDLLRRHADLLARELRDTGIAGADLSFTDNSGAGQRQGAADRDRHEGFSNNRVTSRNEVPAPVTRPRPALGSLIDIRI